jgi:hypothetical protein
MYFVKRAIQITYFARRYPMQIESSAFNLHKIQSENITQTSSTTHSSFPPTYRSKIPRASSTRASGAINRTGVIDTPRNEIPSDLTAHGHPSLRTRPAHVSAII